MKAGICWIKFKEGVTDEQIQVITTSFYAENEKIIENMQFDQLKDDKVLDRARRLFHKTEGSQQMLMQINPDGNITCLCGKKFTGKGSLKRWEEHVKTCKPKKGDEK